MPLHLILSALLPVPVMHQHFLSIVGCDPLQWPIYVPPVSVSVARQSLTQTHCLCQSPGVSPFLRRRACVSVSGAPVDDTDTLTVSVCQSLVSAPPSDHHVTPSVCVSVCS